MRHVIKTGSAAVTDGALIADPGDGFKIIIFGVHFAAAADCKLTIEHGSTTLHSTHVTDTWATSTVDPIGRKAADARWVAPASTAVIYTTDTSVDQVVEVWYDVVSTGT